MSLARRVVLVGLAAAVLAEAALLRAAIARTFYDPPVLVFETAALVVFVVGVALFAVSGIGGQAGSRVVLGVSTLLQLVMVTKPPVDSDDDYRYLWDAKVQLAGVDPYRYAPTSPSLVPLREPFLFPPEHCPGYPIPGGCTRINLPNAHTIYPPVAEATFTLLRLVSFDGHGRHLPLQLAAATGVLAVSWLLARHALAHDHPLWTVALWAWCPVTAIELSNNAHIDWLAVLLSVLALTVLARGRLILAGILLGAGIATKLYPGLLGASMLRRRPVVVVVAAGSTVALSYLPHLLAVGGAVLGYLPDYLQTGGYGDGRKYRLIAWALPTGFVTPVAILLVTAAVGWALLRTDPARQERSALIVVGVAILVSTPTLPWYTLLLLALAALNNRPEWLGVIIAPTIEYVAVGAYHLHQPTATTIAYAAGLLLLIVGITIRRFATTTGSSQRVHVTPAR